MAIRLKGRENDKRSWTLKDLITSKTLPVHVRVLVGSYGDDKTTYDLSTGDILKINKKTSYVSVTICGEDGQPGRNPLYDVDGCLKLPEDFNGQFEVAPRSGTCKTVDDVLSGALPLYIVPSTGFEVSGVSVTAGTRLKVLRKIVTHMRRTFLECIIMAGGKRILLPGHVVGNFTLLFEKCYVKLADIYDRLPQKVSLPAFSIREENMLSRKLPKNFNGILYIDKEEAAEIRLMDSSEQSLLWPLSVELEVELLPEKDITAARFEPVINIHNLVKDGDLSQLPFLFRTIGSEENDPSLSGISGGDELEVHHIKRITALYGVTDKASHILIPSSYEGTFEEEPKIYPVAEDLVPKGFGRYFKVTKSYLAEHIDLGTLRKGDIIEAKNRLYMKLRNQHEKGEFLQVKKLQDSGSLSKMLVIPLYAQCDFREIPEDGSAEEYTVKDLMAKDLPMSVLQVSDSDDPDQPWIEGVDAITLLKKVTYSSLVACIRDKPTRNRMEIPGFVELYGRQVKRARVEQRQLEWTPTVRTITAQQGKELESCELYDLIEKTPLLPPRPVQQTSAPDLNWATPSTKSTPHSLDQPTPALTQSEAAQPEAAPKSGFRKMLKSFKGLRTISISSSSEDKDKKKNKEGDVKLLDRFKRNIPKFLTAGKSTKPGSNAGTPQSDSEDSDHVYLEADDVEVLGQPRRSTWAGDGLKGRGTLEESESDDSDEYDDISDLTDSKETGKAFPRVRGQTVIAAPKRSLSEGDESRSHGVTPSAGNTGQLVGKRIEMLRKSSVYKGDDEAMKEVQAELSALKQPTLKMATEVKDRRNIGYVGMYPDNKQKKSMVKVPPPDGDIYEFDVDDIEKLLAHLNCSEDVRQLFVSDKIDGKAMCQLTVPVLKEKYHLSRKPLFDVLDYIEITNSKNK